MQRGLNTSHIGRIWSAGGRCALRGVCAGPDLDISRIRILGKRWR